MAFGTNLEKLRRSKGIQLPELEKNTGISQARLKKLESNTDQPSLTEVLALSYVLNTTPEDLEFRSDEKAAELAENSQGANSASTWNETVRQQNEGKSNSNAKKKKGKKMPATSVVPKDENWANETAVVEETTTQGKEKCKEDKQEANENIETKSAKDVSKQTLTDEQKKQLGSAMKEIREQKKIPYSKIRAELGINLVTYTQIEMGMYDVSQELLDKIVTFFRKYPS